MASNDTTQRCINATRPARGNQAGKDGKLVLTLSEGECLVIEDRFIIECVSVRGRKVRIGTMAPRDVRIDRGENWLKATFAKAQEAQS